MASASRVRAVFPVGVLLALAACDGDITPPVPGLVQLPVKPGQTLPKPASTCTAQVVPGPAPIRRLTRREYDNTVGALLGDTSHPAAAFNAEEEALGFNNNAAALVTSSDQVEKYMAAAEGIAARVGANLSRLRWYQCDPAREGEDVCAARFVDALGPRAFRRPLSTDEKTALVAVFNQGRALGAVDEASQPLPGFIAGVQLVVTAVLQAPDFLYRVEQSATGADPVPVSDYEMASRLSYLLWGSMPDEALLAAAAKGELRTPDQIKAQAERMLANEAARAMVTEFHAQWLDFGRVHNVAKADTVYPKWNPAIPDLMEQETRLFIEHVIFDNEGTWDALMSAPYSYLNPDLTRFYGLTVPVTADGTFQKFTFTSAPNVQPRSGLLTQGSLLSINAHSNQTSPVHRGKLVRESFLCGVLSPPPKDVMIVVPDPKPGSTARERFAQHSADARCSGCHTLMDPIGFSFEHFDGVGAYRARDNDQPIDDNGELVASDVDGRFQGVPGLSAKLLTSAEAQRCYVKQWFRFGYGRGETSADACSLERLQTAFEQNGHDVKKLIVSLTQTDAFRYRARGPTP